MEVGSSRIWRSREKSSRLATVRSILLRPSWIRSRYFSRISTLSGSARMFSMQARMPPSGLLTSWATPAARVPTATIFSVCDRCAKR